MSILDTVKRVLKKDEVVDNAKPKAKRAPRNLSKIPTLEVKFPHPNDPQFNFKNWETTPPSVAALEAMTHKLFVAHQRHQVAIRHKATVAAHNQANEVATT